MTAERHSAAAAGQLADRLPPLLVAAERVAAALNAGIHGRRRAGGGETFWQSPHAPPGDRAAAIDWRRSARGPGLFVREAEWAAAQGVWLWADGSASMDWRSAAALPAKRDRAGLLALALAAALLRGGERVAWLGVGDGRPACGPGSLERLAHDLRAAFAAPAPAAWPQPERLPRHGELVLISDFLLPEAVVTQGLAALAGWGVHGHLLQVLDPAEETLPYGGRVRFAGLEGDGEVLIRRAEDARAPYAARLGDHRAMLAARAAAHGWTFACHHTDRPPQDALLALFARLSLPRGGARP